MGVILSVVVFDPGLSAVLRYLPTRPFSFVFHYDLVLPIPFSPVLQTNSHTPPLRFYHFSFAFVASARALLRSMFSTILTTFPTCMYLMPEIRHKIL
ncbi:hypothetical protein EDB86DRAFT_2920783 [Lactarius hatsudake]|nr:hypothetical protein EDB86DRAFT_2920783 [Lactarius hatsudake]